MLYNNLERLKMEIKGIDYPDGELEIYLMENGLNYEKLYEPTSNVNKRGILQTALAILESVANNPELMKDYKFEEQSVSNFHENLMNRIDQLESKIRKIPNSDEPSNDNGGSFYLFNK